MAPQLLTKMVFLARQFLLGLKKSCVYQQKKENPGRGRGDHQESWGVDSRPHPFGIALPCPAEV